MSREARQVRRREMMLVAGFAPIAKAVREGRAGPRDGEDPYPAGEGPFWGRQGITATSGAGRPASARAFIGLWAFGTSSLVCAAFAMAVADKAAARPGDEALRRRARMSIAAWLALAALLAGCFAALRARSG